MWAHAPRLGLLLSPQHLCPWVQSLRGWGLPEFPDVADLPTHPSQLPSLFPQTSPNNHTPPASFSPSDLKCPCPLRSNSQPPSSLRKMGPKEVCVCVQWRKTHQKVAAAAPISQWELSGHPHAPRGTRSIKCYKQQEVPATSSASPGSELWSPKCTEVGWTSQGHGQAAPRLRPEPGLQTPVLGASAAPTALQVPLSGCSDLLPPCSIFSTRRTFSWSPICI